MNTCCVGFTILRCTILHQKSRSNDDLDGDARPQLEASTAGFYSGLSLANFVVGM